MNAKPDDLRTEMLSYDSCLVSDALEKLGLPIGIAGIDRRATTRRIFGRVVTVRLGPPSDHIPKKHLGTTAIEVAEVGDVIVVEHRSRADCAGWGGLLSTAAAAKGLSGVIVDGLARDIDESEALDFPVFARAVTPVTARGKVVEIATNDPIDVAGVPVRPGDYVIADGSGIAIIPADRLDEVVAEARSMMAFENGIRVRLSQGHSIGSAMDRSYETLLLREPSSGENDG